MLAEDMRHLGQRQRALLQHNEENKHHVNVCSPCPQVSRGDMEECLMDMDLIVSFIRVLKP